MSFQLYSLRNNKIIDFERDLERKLEFLSSTKNQKRIF